MVTSRGQQTRKCCVKAATVLLEHEGCQLREGFAEFRWHAVFKSFESNIRSSKPLIASVGCRVEGEILPGAPAYPPRQDLAIDQQSRPGIVTRVSMLIFRSRQDVIMPCPLTINMINITHINIPTCMYCHVYAERRRAANIQLFMGPSFISTMSPRGRVRIASRTSSSRNGYLASLP